MTLLKKAKKEKTPSITLDNGIEVKVRRMSEQDRLRAAGIFDPKTISRAEKKTIRNSEAMDLWQGNEAYTIFVVDRSCTLVSSMPLDDAWLRQIKRNRRAYGVALEDLEDDDFLQVLYIRFQGMTTEEYLSSVIDIAMDIKPTKPADTEKKADKDEDDENEDEETEEDEE